MTRIAPAESNAAVVIELRQPRGHRVQLAKHGGLGSLHGGLLVSREAREVIKLRDDVLDEVNQLYFERQRVLGDLAATPADDPASLGLRLRAEELAAGLDGWTGGWFTRRLAGNPP